jgi:amino acid adenylation domain-containing protein
VSVDSYSQQRQADFEERRASAERATPPVASTVVHWLQRGAAQHPDAAAVQDGEARLSHSELEALSNRIAHRLLAAGVRRGDRVGLCADRSIELIGCLVGILKCGAAYVPLDPGYPPERLAIMQEEADLRLVVTSAAQMSRLGSSSDRAPTASSSQVLTWEPMAAELDVFPATPPPGDVGPDDVAYVIFTSGSTGRPKGVEMPHRALANLIEWQLDRTTFRSQARVLQYSSISFDVSFQEIATTIASGGHLFMIPDERRRDPRELMDALRTWRIERLFLPFVALRSLVEVAATTDGLPPDLTEIITAGEQLRVDDTMRDVFARGGRPTLDNQYGPSETHVITAHQLDGDPDTWPDLPPIGRVLPNCCALVFDDDMQPVAPGEVGQLFLGGRNLALGYFGRPDRIRESFIVDPRDPDGHSRLYRTGDLASVDDRGEIHYHGRTDHQIKIRGHRVEPGEVSAVASRLDGVAQCLTHTFRKPSGAPYLVTYFTTGADSSVEPTKLRAHLREHLPEYMVPAFVIELDHIAFGPSGKADLSALPDPRTTSASRALGHAVYETPTEKRLASIWRDVLEFPTIPRDASFFDLGGDSLAAVTLFLRISEEFGRELPLATLGHSSTIATLADRIDEQVGLQDNKFRSLQLLQEGRHDVPPLFLVHGGGGNVLIFAELAARLGPDQTVYALQWSGWDGGRGERTVPEMAAAYQCEILDVAPVGPYRLGGHCIGGLIAIELAQRMAADGAVIDGPLVVSDAPNLRASSYHREDPRDTPISHERFEAMAAELLDAVPRGLRIDGWRGYSRTPTSTGTVSGPTVRQRMRALLRRSPRLVRFLKRSHDRIRTGRAMAALALGRPVPMLWRLGYCAATLRQAAAVHRPTPWSGDIVYFRTATFEGNEMALEGWWDDVHMGFAELAEGRFDAHVVGGPHNEPLKLAYVADVVRRAFGDPAPTD